MMMVLIMNERWQNQEEAYQFAKDKQAVMLDMDMGTGKTKVAIDLAFDNPSIRKVLISCPKSVVEVWPKELAKWADGRPYYCWYGGKISVTERAKILSGWQNYQPEAILFVVIHYDIVWRQPLATAIRNFGFDLVINDESHRIKSAGSKVSKFMALMGRDTKYRLCLSGTPMANSPLDVYGQYRFLDRTIFGTRIDDFENTYAIKGGPNGKMTLGYHNQEQLMNKFNTIAYTCKMADIKDRLKLPDKLPPMLIEAPMPTSMYKISRDLVKEFISEVGEATIVLDNVLHKILRLQQITSGFCMAQTEINGPNEMTELHTTKADMLREVLEDNDKSQAIVVFCIFQHDLRECKRVVAESGREAYELSGAANQLAEWQKAQGGVLVTQIQAGAEGVDMTKSNICVYYSLPCSLALYEQSQARLYRPGQKHPVVFIYLLVENSVDGILYETLVQKKDLITSIKNGSVDFGYIYRQKSS